MEPRHAVGEAVPDHPAPSLDLWTVDLDRYPVSPSHPGLTPKDRADARRIRDPRSSRRLLTRRWATRTIVAHSIGQEPEALGLVRMCRHCGATDHGRPFVPGSPIDFSVSASGGLGMVAVSPGPVGIDLELWRSGLEPVRAALTTAEQRVVASWPAGERARGFLRLWAAKEALLKASHRSLKDDPASVDVVDVVGARVDEAVPVEDGGRTWLVRLLRLAPPEGMSAEQADNSALAVVDEGGGAVVRRDWSELPLG